MVGLGSNVLAADSGVDGLVLRLSGELAAVEIDGTRLTAGGGAPNAVSLHRARAAGLGGMEFACAIPGTAGGGVRMNAGAYGRDWADIVERVLVVDANGAAWLAPDELDFSYRHSSLARGRVVARVEFRLTPRDATDIRLEVAELNRRRKETQPINRRTFGSVFKIPPASSARARCWTRAGSRDTPSAEPESHRGMRTSSRTPAGRRRWTH